MHELCAGAERRVRHNQWQRAADSNAFNTPEGQVNKKALFIAL